MRFIPARLRYALPLAGILALTALFFVAAPFTRAAQPSPAATESRLVEPGASGGEEFGYAVAASGAALVVGSWQGDLAGQDSGAAYVWRWDGSAWNLEASLSGADVQPAFLCGRSVAIDRDTALVGCFADYRLGSNTGSAYVFTRSGGVWTQQAKLVAPDATPFSFYGWSVAVSGDTAVVGAYSEGTNFSTQGRGAAYVYQRANGAWAFKAKLRGDQLGPQGRFGWAVAAGSNGSRILVTDPLEGVRDGTYPVFFGAGHVYTRVGGEWVHEASLSDIVLDSDHQYESRGFSVALAGDTAVLGAPDFTRDSDVHSGRAYYYVRSGGIWTLKQTLEASDAAYGDRFGASVALGRGFLLVGADGDDTASLDSGAVYQFRLQAGTWTPGQQFLLSAPVGGEQAGWSVAIAAGQATGGAISDDTVAPGAGSVIVWR